MVEDFEKAGRLDLQVDDTLIRLSVDAESTLYLPHIRKDEAQKLDEMPLSIDNSKSGAADKEDTSRSGQETLLTSVKLAKTLCYGPIRHRLVVAGCFCLSALILALSTIDLSPAIKRSATIDRSFSIQYEPKKAELAPNLTYYPVETYYDYNGRVVYRPDYYRERYQTEALRPVLESTWDKKQVGFVDEAGNVIIKPQFSDVGNFHEGLAPAKPFGAQSDLWGYIDKSGKFVISPQFRSVGNFCDGVVAVVTTEWGEALIDRTGRCLTKGTRLINRGQVYVVKQPNGKCGLVNKQGQWVTSPEFYRIDRLPVNHRHINVPLLETSAGAKYNVSDRYFKIWKHNLCGVINSSGKVIIPPKFEEILSFKNGHAAVCLDGKYGFVDSNGNLIVPPRFDYVTPFDDLIAARDDKKWCFLNSHGKALGVAKADGIIYDRSGEWLSDGLGAVIVNGLCGFVNNKGELVIKPRFEFALGFKEGYAEVWDGTTWRYIDRKGNYASPDKFGTVSPFFQGRASVTIAGPLYSFTAAQTICNANKSFDNLKRCFASFSPDVRPCLDEDWGG